VAVETPAAEARLALEVPHPNPSAGAATVRYRVDEARPVRLVVYDVLGREVARLVDEVQTPGWRQAALPGHLKAGTYVIRLSAGSASLTRRFARL
jgi:hypothetical protein